MYCKKETRDIYDKLLRICYEVEHEWQQAMDKLVEFLTIDNSPPFIKVIPDGMKWLDKDNRLRDKLLEVYNAEVIDLLRSDWYDYLGDIYVENQGTWSKSIRCQFFTPMNITELMAKMMMIGEDKEDPNIIDPCVGSGRMLLSAARVKPQARCFGVDIDLQSIHIGICNCALHNVHGYFLHADSLLHEIDIQYLEGQYNWRFANSWVSHWDKLKEMKPLKHRTEETQYRITVGDDAVRLTSQDLKNPQKVLKRREQIKKATYFQV